LESVDPWGVLLAPRVAFLACIGTLPFFFFFFEEFIHLGD
jgi:hypothetical protein